VAWYREWFGEDYLELYAHRDRDEAERQADFVERQLADVRPRAVLDLACGAGRHTDALRRRGHRVLGTDLSITLLARRPDLPRVAGDMRRLPFVDASFDWVLNFFTSFGYFESERENFQVLEEVVRVLTPGGGFLVDLMNPVPVIESLKPGESWERAGRKVEIERWYDPEARRINKRIRIARDGQPARTFLESVRAYRADEVEIGLQWAGLRVRGVYGSFGGEAYGPDSDRLIVVAKKEG
jgi:SAM-dependent methyltransferase